MLPYFTISDLNQVSDLNDNDLFIISRYNPSSREYTSYNVKAEDMGILTKFKIENSNNIKIYIAPKKDLNGDTLVTGAGDDNNLENQFKYYGTPEQQNYPLFTVNAAMKLSDRILFQRDEMGDGRDIWSTSSFCVHILCHNGIYEYNKVQNIFTQYFRIVRITPYENTDSDYVNFITEDQETIYEERIAQISQPDDVPEFPFLVKFVFTNKDSCGFCGNNIAFDLLKITGPIRTPDPNVVNDTQTYYNNTIGIMSGSMSMVSITSCEISNFNYGLHSYSSISSKIKLYNHKLNNEQSNHKYDYIQNYIHDCYYGISDPNTTNILDLQNNIIISDSFCILKYDGYIDFYGKPTRNMYSMFITNKHSHIFRIKNGYLDANYVNFILKNNKGMITDTTTNFTWIDGASNTLWNRSNSFGYYVDNVTINGTELTAPPSNP